MAATVRTTATPLMTIAAFETFLAGVRDDDRYELIDGEIVLMTDPSNRHETIVGQIGVRLSSAVERRDGETFQGKTGLQASGDGTDDMRVIPDIMVRCGARTREHYAWNYITDPLVVIEVLSPSTDRYDKLRKVPFYLSLPSTHHVVVVHQDERRIEHWHRPTAEAPWAPTVLPRDGETLALGAVAFEITLDEAYGDVPLGNL